MGSPGRHRCINDVLPRNHRDPDGNSGSRQNPRITQTRHPEAEISGGPQPQTTSDTRSLKTRRQRLPSNVWPARPSRKNKRTAEPTRFTHKMLPTRAPETHAPPEEPAPGTGTKACLKPIPLRKRFC